jgi:hypothetical protein
VKKEEHIMDVLRRAEEHTQAQRNRVEADVVEAVSWQIDYQEVEQVARQRAAEAAAVAAESAALRASMIAASAAASSSSSSCSHNDQEDNTSSTQSPSVFVFSSSLAGDLHDIIHNQHGHHGHNRERQVLRELEVIERKAMRDSDKFLEEAEGAAFMQRELADRVKQLEIQVQQCEVASMAAQKLKDEAKQGQEQHHQQWQRSSSGDSVSVMTGDNSIPAIIAVQQEEMEEEEKKQGDKVSGDL